MQRPIVTVPPCIFAQVEFAWDIDWRSISVGETTDGTTRTHYDGFPRFVGSPVISLTGAAMHQWRAIRAAARGKVGLYEIEMTDLAFVKDPVGGITNSTGVPFSTGQPFSTGRGFAYRPFVLAAADAPRGATSLTISTTGKLPIAGQIMSANKWPFIVTSITDMGGDEYKLTVEPPLREAISTGDTILHRGVGIFEARESSMGMPVYSNTQQAQISLDFIEVLQR